MTKTTKLLAAALLLAASDAHAAFTVYVYQSGADVRAYGSGTLNPAGLTFVGVGGTATGLVPVNAQLFIGTQSSVDVYDGLTGPVSWGAGLAASPTSVSGQRWGVNGATGRMVVPEGNVAGSPLVTQATWAGTTLAALGITPGDYVYTWAGDSFTVRVGVAPSADLSITKTDGVATVNAGSSLTYTITASNAGPAAVIGATVADILPPQLTATWTCLVSGGATCTAAGAGNIADTVDLPAGGSVTYTVNANVSPSAAAGTLSNTATIAAPAAVADPNPANNSATDVDTLVAPADLAITKTDGVAAATPGGVVTYTITASNAGPLPVVGATVSDTFPAGVTATWTCLAAGGASCTAAGAGNISDTVNLPVGGSVTYTANATISIAAVGTLTNTATVAAPAGITDPNPANNSATDIDTLGAAPLTTYTGPSATGSGTITASFTPVGLCGFSAPQFIGPPPGAPPVPPSAPVGIAFPHGLFDFSIAGCAPSATVVITITYPQALPPGASYYKYGPTASDPTPHWYVMPAAIAGNTATITIVDGGLGDDDLTANGTIVDQGGPGIGTGTAVQTPTMSEWMMLLMGVLMLGYAWRRNASR